MIHGKPKVHFHDEFTPDSAKRFERLLKERNCRAKQNDLRCCLDASHSEFSDHLARIDGHFEGEQWVETKLVKFSTKKISDGTSVDGEK
jgi:hypothetical protein